MEKGWEEYSSAAGGLRVGSLVDEAAAFGGMSRDRGEIMVRPELLGKVGRLVVPSTSPASRPGERRGRRRVAPMAAMTCVAVRISPREPMISNGRRREAPAITNQLSV